MVKETPMAEFVQVLTTTNSRELADTLARALVERRLAACVQIAGPVKSVYRWQGTIETADEWQCWIKTTRERFVAVERAIRELHTYTVPEIIAVPIVAGSADYLKWLGEETSDPPPTSG
jgi:periplasmic divalent cation tolerance protein